MLPISQTDYFSDLSFLQSLIDSLQEGVVLQNRKGEIISFNKKACTILNLSPDQIIGKSSYDPQWEAIHLDGSPAPGHTHPIAITLRTGEPMYDVIMGVKTGIAHIKWLSVNTKLVSVNDEVLAFATFTDVSELIASNFYLVKEKEKLKASEEKFEKSFIYSAIGKAIVSPTGEMKEVNEALCRMLGYTKEELIQKTFQDITHPDDLEKDMALVQQMLNKEIENYQLEKRYIHKSGATIWALLNVALVWDGENRPQFFISQIQEITEVKKLNKWLEDRNKELLRTQAELKRKIGQLKDFAGIVTHDVRGPAGNIQKMLYLYETSETEEIKQKSYHYLKKVTDELNNNLNELVEVLQIHLDKDIPFTECNFAAITDSICLQLRDSFTQTNAKIITDFQLDNLSYPKIYLQSILYNLISNSLKYVRENVTPIIQVTSFEENGNAFLVLSDNGLGIDMQKFGSQLFQFQKNFHEGFDSKGIGLYLIKNQIEELGGTISAESEVNKGSVFTVRF